MNTRVTELLSIKHPILQGAMAWISDGELAAAVSNTGGLGIIAAGNAPVSWVKEQINIAKNKTSNPFAVNIMLMSPTAPEIAQLVCDEGVKVVTTGAGSPAKYIDMWKKAEIIIIPVIASVSQAIKMEKLGADAVVAEGTEAGGHIGELTTMTLTPQVADAVNIPIITAGGIADGRGMAAAFILGGEGVQIGTRFVMCSECNVHENYKNSILKAKDTDTLATGRSTGHPVRCIKNSFARNITALEKNHEDTEKLEKMLNGTLKLAAVDGDVKNGSVMAGQCAGMINEIKPAKEIIKEILTDAAKYLKMLEGLFSAGEDEI